MPGAEEAQSVLSLPKGGGALKGMGETFAPDLHTGTGNFTVPIALLPGRNGFQPQLSLTYSTGHGNGLFGMGWSLSVPGIARKTAKGIPRYRDMAASLVERDTFILSGSEDLVFIGRVNDEAGVAVDQYRPRTEGLFAEIFRYRDAAQGSDYWRVRTKDGLVSFYGTNPAPSTHPHYAVAPSSDPAVISRPRRATDIFEWRLTLTQDSFGNRIEYLYDIDAGKADGHEWKQPLLAQIRYGDSGDRAAPQFLITVTFQYEDRVDAFSDYRAGFEIRTSRRCRSIHVETHANRVRPTRRYDFMYRQDSLTAFSLLRAINVVGFDDAGKESHELPPLEFDYTDFDPQDSRRRNFYPLKGATSPPTALSNPSIELVDLFGCGLPDFLEMSGSAVRYWRNRGGGRFAVPRKMDTAPPEMLGAAGVQFIDANGDGRTDLLVTRNNISGYYPLQFGGLWDRRSFQPYGYAPSFDLKDPEVRVVDLTGDGITDVIRSGTRLECFFNDPYEGWQPHNTFWAQRGPLEDFPNVNFSDPRVKWGDFSGDGLQDIALIYDGSVVYWPNRGYGQWSKRLYMKHSPRFAFGYDPKRILVGDVNGDGLADVVYVDDRKVFLWINQSGNSWSDRIEILGTPPVSDMDSVRLVDLLGSGICGILWTRDARSASDDHYFFLDLTGGMKPYLLAEMNNNMGAVTKVAYAPSTKFYLEDEKSVATGWRTPLPFPVQVVTQVEVIDEISGGKLTTEYRYHGGYWDGVEREHRGFSCVEQLDTESFEKYSKAGLHGADAAFAAVDRQYFSPPTLTKTWFHQGAIGDDAVNFQELDCSDEFWAGDAQQLGHVDGVNQQLAQLRQQYAGLTSRERRQIERDALRSLRGSVMRTEVYGLDGSAREDRPYSVAEHAYGFREESVPNGTTTRQRIFFPHPLAQRTTQWDCGDDPMTSLAYMRDYDAFGNPLTAIQVACPRGWRNLDDAIHGATYLATIGKTQIATSANDLVYIHDRAARVAQYEIVNPTLPAGPIPGRSVADLLTLALDPNNLRIVSEAIRFYDADPNQPNKGEYVGLPFGTLGRYGAVTRTESLVLTDAIVNAAYPGQPPPYLQPGQPFAAGAAYPSAFVAQLAPLAGYVYHAAGGAYSGGYYVDTERKRFDFHGSGTVRGLMLASLDALGAETTIAYDQPYSMLPVTVTNAVNVSVSASYNYRVLQVEAITDANGNQPSVTFSPTGLVTAVWVRGKPGQGDGDLARPSVTLDYDFLAQPAFVRTVRSVRHESDPDFDPSETIESRDYSDGFGRVVQTRTQGEHVRFGDPIFGGGDSVLPALQSAGAGGTVRGVQNNSTPSPNVIVSGWQRCDNKGRVVEKFEPFFATGWAYAPPRDSADPAQRDFGVKVTMFYDSRGRMFRTVNPDGSEQRVVYGVPQSLDDPTDPDQIVPTPWETFTYDTNDNAGRTHPGTSGDYRHHWNTPASSVSDALGRTIIATVRNRAKPASAAAPLPTIDAYHTRSTYDIQGNVLQVRDALNRVAFVHSYDLTKHALRIESIDAGTRSIVFDAMGREIERADSKGARVLGSYDVLGRPDRTWARNDGNQAMTLRQHTFYGDGGDANQPAPTRDQARAGNSLSRVTRQLDEAGELSFTAYDFKGNVSEKARRVIADAPLIAALDAPGGPARGFTVDWDQPPALSGNYQTSYAYDALNRLTTLQYPADVSGARKKLVPSYNNAGELESVRIDGDVFVERIVYNAKGQRVHIAYGNRLMTRYAYDPTTLRLARLRTDSYVGGGLIYAPKGVPLQDFAYEYDLAGNVLRVTEQTPGCGVRNNAQATLYPQLQAQLAAGDALVRDFEYDPLYRLTLATGREANNISMNRRPWGDLPRDGFNWGAPGTPTPDTARDQTRLYQETYSYDAAGNMLAVGHGTWTRYFGISDFSPQAWAQEWPKHLDPTNAWAAATSNRLTHVGARTSAAPTHFFDADGNLVRENTERHFAWDALDRMMAFANRASGGNATIEACYLYDPAGQRTKKLVRKGASVEVAVYVDGLFEHHIVGAQENNSLHVMDGKSRLALIRVGAALQGDTGPDIQYHLGDRLGSSHIVVGGSDSKASAFSNREEFFPYGDTSFGSYARKRYRFTGKERDEESGLNYHGYRYYVPSILRWSSCDHYGKRNEPNMYVYVRNSPINLVDSTGLYAQPGHYYSTYIAALMAGFAPDVAYRTAFFTQMPDQVVQLDARAAGEAWVFADAVHHKQEKSDIWSHLQIVERGGHSLTGANVSTERERREATLTSLTPGTVAHGLASHAYEDAYAHEKPNTNFLFSPPLGHAPDESIDAIARRPELWEQSFRQLLRIYQKQSPSGKATVSQAEIDKFVEEVKSAHADGPGGDQKAEIAVMEKWGQKLAGLLYQRYAPENEGKTSWESFRASHPRETENLQLSDLLGLYQKWMDQTEPMPNTTSPTMPRVNDK